MKKIISLALLVVTLLNSSITASASTSERENKETQISAGIIPTFIVTIPKKISLEKSVIISVSNVLVEESKAVKISIIDVNNGDTDFNVKSDSGTSIKYSVMLENNKELKLNEELIFEEDREQVIDFMIHKDIESLYADNYSGSVIFKISYEDIK